MLHGYSGDIFDMHRLDGIVTHAKDTEDRKFSQHPGDVVDQYIPTAAEQHRRTENRIGVLRVVEESFDRDLATKVGPVGCLVWMSD